MGTIESYLLLVLIFLAIGYVAKKNRYMNFIFHSTISISKQSEQKYLLKDNDENGAKQTNISVNKNNGPVQITTEGSKASQKTEDCNFFNDLIEYKELMVNANIPEDDINFVIANSTDTDVKESFLSKYGMDLAKIMVNIGGSLVSLLSVLKE